MTLVFCRDRVKCYLNDHKAKALRGSEIDHRTNPITFLTVIYGENIYLHFWADTPLQGFSILFQITLSTRLLEKMCCGLLTAKPLGKKNVINHNHMILRELIINSILIHPLLYLTVD